MKKNNVVLKSLIIISLTLLTPYLFYTGYSSESKTNQISGNGNPAGILVAILLLLCPFIIIGIIILFDKVNAKNSSLLVTMGLTITYNYIGYIHQKNNYLLYKEFIKQKIIHSEDVTDVTYSKGMLDGFSIYMNSQFFNLNTYFMYLCFILFLASLAYLIYKETLKVILKLLRRN